MMKHDPEPAQAQEPAQPCERLLVPTREAARMLGLSPRTLWSLTACNAVPHVRIGKPGAKKGRVMYSPASLQAWITAKEQGADHE